MLIFQYYSNIENLIYTPLIKKSHISYNMIYEITRLNSNFECGDFFTQDEIQFNDQLFPLIERLMSPGLFYDYNPLIGNQQTGNSQTQWFQNSDFGTPEDTIQRASKHMLKSLNPYKKVSSINGFLEKECSICMEKYTLHKHVRVLSCGHDFHKCCIDKWLVDGSVNCPICRKNAFSL